MKLEITVDSDELIEKLAIELAGNEELAEKVSGNFSAEDIASVIPAECVAEHIDTDDLAEKVASSLNEREIAEYIDAEEIARHIDCDNVAYSLSRNDTLVEQVIESLDSERIMKEVCSNLADEIASKITEKILAAKAKQMDEIRKLILELGAKIAE